MVTGHDELASSARRPAGLRDGRPRLRDHHAPAGLEVLRPLRSVPRLHGRLPRVEEALSPRPGLRPLGRGQGASGFSSPREAGGDEGCRRPQQKALKFFNLRAKQADELAWEGPLVSLTTVTDFAQVLGPDAKKLGTLTEPREFNLMFKTIVGALGGEEGAAFLRPETAQGMFVNFKNVLDSTRVRVPFGIAPDRQELPQRDHAAQLHLPLARVRADGDRVLLPSRASRRDWYQYWRDRRYQWYIDLGLAGERLRLRDHTTGGIEPLFLRHGRHRIRLPVPAAGRVRRIGRHRPSRRLRPPQPHGRQARAQGRTTSSSRLDADGKPRHRGSGKDLSYFDDMTQASGTSRT